MSVSKFEPDSNTNKLPEDFFYTKTSIKDGRQITEIIYDEDPSKGWHKFKELFNCCCNPVTYQHGGKETKDLIAKLLSGGPARDLSFNNDKTRLMALRHFEQIDVRLIQNEDRKAVGALTDPPPQMLPSPPPTPPIAAAPSDLISPQEKSKKEGDAAKTPTQPAPPATAPADAAAAPQLLPLTITIEPVALAQDPKPTPPVTPPGVPKNFDIQARTQNLQGAQNALGAAAASAAAAPAPSSSQPPAKGENNEKTEKLVAAISIAQTVSQIATAAAGSSSSFGAVASTSTLFPFGAAKVTEADQKKVPPAIKKALEAQTKTSEVSKSAVEKRTHGLKTFKRLYTGMPKGARPISSTYLGEAIDEPKHRYGSDLNQFYKAWRQNKVTTDSFVVWMDKLEAGQNVPGATKELLEKAKIPSVKYLKAAERASYIAQIQQNTNRITNQHLASNLTTNAENPQIFVISPDNKIYVGTYVRREFHHSSFLEGGAVKGAGEFYFKDGVLKRISSKSGHYWPDEITILRSLFTLKGAGIDLSKVGLTLLTEGEPPHDYPIATEFMEEMTKALEDTNRSRPSTFTYTIYNWGYRDFEDYLACSERVGMCMLRSSRNLLQQDVLVFGCSKINTSQPDTCDYYEVYIRKENGFYTIQSVYPYRQEKSITNLDNLDAVVSFLQEMTETSAPQNFKPTSSQYQASDLNQAEAFKLLSANTGVSFVIRNSQSKPKMVAVSYVNKVTGKLAEEYLTLEENFIVRQPIYPTLGERKPTSAASLDEYIDLLRQNKMI
jgi:hypothetical protein